MLLINMKTAARAVTEMEILFDKLVEKGFCRRLKVIKLY